MFITNPASIMYLRDTLEDEPKPKPLDGVAKGVIKAQDEHSVTINKPCHERSGLIFVMGNIIVNIVN